MSIRFDGQVAIVTGAGGGLGRQHALALAARGAKVVVNDFGRVAEGQTMTAAEAVVREIEAAGGTAVVNAASVTDEAGVAAMVAETMARWGRIDILVNNAGITRDATFRKLSYADWDAVLRVNLDSVFNVTRPFIDGMLERGWGRIVNIASINGSKGQFGQTNYSAAKAGMHGFTKALAQEVARKGVTVNTVSPGYLDTKMVTSMSEEVVKQVTAGIPVGRLGRPEEIAALVAFIASESAGFMTGSNVSMNGGQHMY